MLHDRLLVAACCLFLLFLRVFLLFLRVFLLFLRVFLRASAGLSCGVRPAMLDPACLTGE
ncbi:hypothetical protein ACFVT1_18440 [Streptomyces sp. NPDC057963]|uniref:hypothetical protein n=1 Tax=Streptomyces sp. NPDC057963 TaxID=3346290 RepID=UPI0036E4F2C7